MGLDPLGSDPNDSNSTLPDYSSSDDEIPRTGDNINDNLSQAQSKQAVGTAEHDNISSQTSSIAEELALTDAHAPIGYIFGVQEPSIYCDTIINMGSTSVLPQLSSSEDVLLMREG